MWKVCICIFLPHDDQQPEALLHTCFSAYISESPAETGGREGESGGERGERGTPRAEPSAVSGQLIASSPSYSGIYTNIYRGWGFIGLGPRCSIHATWMWKSSALCRMTRDVLSVKLRG